MRTGDVTDPERLDAGKPLDGVRVLAVEQMQSLPYATQLMARLGADVVKVEHPERGDLGRGSTPAVTDASGRAMGATFLRNNLSKRSVGIDLKSPDGRDLVRALAPHFDVFAENLRPGTLPAMGLAFDDIVAVHPTVVYLSISGFGNTTDTPYASWPAFAPIAEAMAGLYAFNRSDDEPAKVSPVGALGDTGTGLFGVIGMLAGLRQRDRTGEPQYADVAMFDSMVAFADIVPNYWSLGKDPRTPTAMINDSFSIDSGELVIQIGREHQFARLCELIGRPRWVDDERFATRDGWRTHLPEIAAALREWAGDRTTIAAAEALAGAGIAAAPIFEARDLVDDPHVAARHMLVEMPIDDTTVLTTGNPVKLQGVAEGPDRPPPTLGEHTRGVLAAELGLDDHELDRLTAAGVIA